MGTQKSMKNKWMKLVVGCMMSLCLSVPAFAGDQIDIEYNLTRIAQTTLDSMFGHGNFIVRVRVALTEPKYQVKYTQQSKVKKTGKKTEDKVYILPGYPALKNISPGDFNKMPFDSVTTQIQPKIRKVLAYVIVNKDFPRGKARLAEPTLKEVLALVEGRDEVKLVYKKFEFKPQDSTQQITLVPGKEKLLSFQNLFYLLTIILMLVFIALYVFFTGKQVSATEKEGDGGSGVNVSVNPNLELPKGGRGGGGDGGNLKLQQAPDMKRFFDFITDDNIQDFIFILKTESLTPEYISMIISFFRPDLAALVIQELEPEQQALVVSQLSYKRKAKREILDKLEKKIKVSLETFMGGESRFKPLMDELGGDTKKSILDLLETSQPDIYDQLRKHILLFEDIILLDDEELQLVLSDANLELISKALVNVDHDLYEKVIENLPSSAKAMVSQFLDLKSESTSKKEAEDAQEYVLSIVQRMDESGQIHLRDKML